MPVLAPRVLWRLKSRTDILTGMMPSVTIDLSGLDGMFLIIPCASGVAYTNQVAGHGCEHPSVEGALCPLGPDPGNELMHKLSSVFSGSWHPPNERQIAMLDATFVRFGYQCLSVDRSRDMDSREAWIYVQVTPPLTPLLGNVVSGVTGSAVLTWPNSD